MGNRKSVNRENKSEGHVCWNTAQTISHIEKELGDCEKWAFFAKKVSGKDMQICVLTPDKMQALMCVMHWLHGEPELWDVLKTTMKEYMKSKI